VVGTFMYMAPEIANEQYGKEIDLWSLGLLMYECLWGKPTWAGDLGSLVKLIKLPVDWHPTFPAAASEGGH
jgi:serine/threonine protein kinase